MLQAPSTAVGHAPDVHASKTSWTRRPCGTNTRARRHQFLRRLIRGPKTIFPRSRDLSNVLSRLEGTRTRLQTCRHGPVHAEAHANILSHERGNETSFVVEETKSVLASPSIKRWTRHEDDGHAREVEVQSSKVRPRPREREQIISLLRVPMALCLDTRRGNVHVCKDTRGEASYVPRVPNNLKLEKKL